MPIYEYACEKCGDEFEVEQRISDAPVKSCPKCRSRKVKRLISQTSFVLKGGGWYSDLYASSGKKAKKEGASEGAGDAAKGGKGEKKSADKADGKGSGASEAAAKSAPKAAA